MSSTLAIANAVYKNSPWLGPDLVARAGDALSAHEEGNYALAVVKSGACLEGILKRVLQLLGIAADSQATLGPLIGGVRDSQRAPKMLLERLNEANTIRNRAPHDKDDPQLSRVTEGDSLQIVNVLGMIVDWCHEKFPSAHDGGDAPELFPVFLSVGGPHRLEQQRFLHQVKMLMREQGVELRTLSSNSYSPDKPFNQIRDLIASCRGALVVGLDRSHAYTVFERERSASERIYQDQYTPTAWNQIEAAIASALRLPILVLREARLHREGVFEAENHDHRICDFDLDKESRALSGTLRELLIGWVKYVRT